MVDQSVSYEFVSPAGKLLLKADEKHLRVLHFISNELDQERSGIQMSGLPENRIIRETVTQLAEYFDGKRIEFNLPLDPQGTAFQSKVWAILQQIPYGKTISYQQLAIKLGDPKSIRAAGTANGKNPIAIIIPCHRVIGSNGSMIGYGGGVWRKQLLLSLENRVGNGARELF